MFTSCSSDDEPKRPSINEVVTHIESVVNTHLGKLYGNKALDHLMLPVGNDVKAQEQAVYQAHSSLNVISVENKSDFRGEQE